ncbi:hypothetical protein GCM10012284_11950 [Mangrovihabitans endophyticus]|uniref:Uncharacterized protein n=1 Tax=Mangrovihabitans endophyticus TaxID=1751298 RepID=A0A8J3FN90_9ACTN|nr:hypothetical protein GCM10012284_11950 [Mangrovihabitans endophyticus]
MAELLAYALPVAQHDGGADGEQLVTAAQCVELLLGEVGGGAVVPAGGLTEVAMSGEKFRGEFALPFAQGGIFRYGIQFRVRHLGVACLQMQVGE